MRHYYAEQSPRGFGNEINVHRFQTRAARDAWVQEHRSDGDCNSAALGARACSARDARRILRDRGDACTRTYHQLIVSDECA